jgi:hypothetical protein
MTQKELHLIDKAAVVAEMEERIKGLKDCHADTVPGYAGEISGLERLLSFLDTLKVEELWKPADGNDLPEIDREVIALVGLEGFFEIPPDEPVKLSYKVVFAHRPPEYWDGKNILTGKVTRIYTKRYDKGGWNQPNVKWWLDLDLPKTEE